METMKKYIYSILASLMLLLSVQIKAQAQCDAPIINSFTPNTGYIGSTVTIFGANFDANPANNQVFFGAVQATVLTASFGKLEVKVPVGATLAPLSVRNTCNKIAYSRVSFNGIFCPTPITATTYSNVSFSMSAKGAYNMIAYDMDLDGKPDVLSGGVSAGGITIARNVSTPGNLSFVRYDLNTVGPQGHAVADFDGDGKLDIVITRSSMHAHRNTSTPGNLSFEPVINIYGAVGFYQVAIGDFNNDGKIDVVSEGGNVVRMFLNTSTGVGNISFVLAGQVNVGTRCTGMQVADVDGDGKVDILCTQGNYNRAVSIRNTTVVGSSAFSFEAPEYWASGGSYPYRCMIADFDKDGKIDLTTCNYSGSANTAIFRNTSVVGNISFATSVNLPAPGANYRIGVGDANGDGFPDIVTKSAGSNVFSVYPNISSGAGDVSFSTRFDYYSSARAEASGIVIADFDGDFVPDIATSGISSNEIRFHRNTSSQDDTTPPTAICKDITLALAPDGTVSLAPEMIDNGSGDACGIDFMTVSKSSFTCADIGENLVDLVVTDNAGNTSTCTATVKIAPAAVIISGQTTVCQGGIIPMSANLGDSYQWKKDGVDLPGKTSQTYAATESGAYSVEVINSGGCSGVSDPVTVVVNNNPTVSTFPSGNAYLCGSSSSATLSASQSSIYKWKLNGIDIPGATQQEYIATTVGTYTVEVIDLFGCSAVSEPIKVSQNDAEIAISGNALAIPSSDATPDLADGTDYGIVFPNADYVSGFVISNQGSETLEVSAITFSGADAASWSFAGITLPASIAPGAGLAFDAVFNGPDIKAYVATLNLVSNDCDETTYSFALKSEITCVAATFNTAPSNMVVDTDTEMCNAVVTYFASVAGTPAPSLSYTFTGATTASGTGAGSGSTFEVGITQVELHVENACGTETVSFNIEVQDNTPPNVLTQDVTVQLNELGMATIEVTDIDAGSNDACGIESLMLDITEFNCDNVGPNTVKLTAVDTNGNSSFSTAIVKVKDNIFPTISVPSDINQMNNVGVCGATINIGQATADDNCSVVSLVNDAPDFFEEGTTVVTWTATDASGNETTAQQFVEVYNVAPVLNTLNVSELVMAGETVVANATFTDNNLVAATWYWGDGSSNAGIITGQSVTGDYVYAAANLFDVRLVIEDACGEMTEMTYSYVVSFDPCAGHITGGGYIDSYSGAYTLGSQSGKAHFEFEGKYHNNSDLNGKFKFKIDSKSNKFEFSSTSMNWLVVNYDQAIFSGFGKVKGSAGNYTYLASIIDGDVVHKGDPDYIRVIIWDNLGNVVYENQPGQTHVARAIQRISKGSIKIHKRCDDDDDKNKEVDDDDDSKKDSKKTSSIADSEVFEFTIYPNPVSNEVNIKFNTVISGMKTIEIYDLTGRMHLIQNNVESFGGIISLNISKLSLVRGSYLIRVKNQDTEEWKTKLFKKE